MTQSRTFDNLADFLRHAAQDILATANAGANRLMECVSGNTVMADLAAGYVQGIYDTAFDHIQIIFQFGEPQKMSMMVKPWNESDLLLRTARAESDNLTRTARGMHDDLRKALRAGDLDKPMRDHYDFSESKPNPHASRITAEHEERLTRLEALRKLRNAQKEIVGDMRRKFQSMTETTLELDELNQADVVALDNMLVKESDRLALLSKVKEAMQ